MTLASKYAPLSVGQAQENPDLFALFAMLDKDGNGVISGAEWSQACSNHREVLCTYFGDTKKLFKRLDTDGNGQLSWEEFKQGAREEAEPVAVVESQEPLYSGGRRGRRRRGRGRRRG